MAVSILLLTIGTRVEYLIFSKIGNMMAKAMDKTWKWEHFEAQTRKLRY